MTIGLEALQLGAVGQGRDLGSRQCCPRLGSDWSSSDGSTGETAAHSWCQAEGLGCPLGLGGWGCPCCP